MAAPLSWQGVLIYQYKESIHGQVNTGRYVKLSDTFDTSVSWSKRLSV